MLVFKKTKNNLTLSDKLELYSCNFSRLITNVQLFSLVNTIDSKYATPYVLYELFKLVFQDNVLWYSNEIFKQMKI
jgi:hypothetical protein